MTTTTSTERSIEPAIPTRVATVTGIEDVAPGESRIVTGVRNHLRHDREVPAPQVQMVGYWRRDP